MTSENSGFPAVLAEARMHAEIYSAYSSVVHLYGQNLGLGSVVEDVWSVGGSYGWLTAGIMVEALSDSANDSASGSGARVITIEGLDDSYNEITEDLALDGATVSAPTAQSFRRINRAYIKHSGTYHAGAAGMITVRGIGAGPIQCEILESDTSGAPWGYGQTQLGRYSVPAGKTALVRQIIVDSVGGKPADVVLFVNDGSVVSAPFCAPRVVRQFLEVSASYGQLYHSPLLLTEKTDIWAKARLLSGASGKVSVDVEIMLYDGVL